MVDCQDLPLQLMHQASRQRAHPRLQSTSVGCELKPVRELPKQHHDLGGFLQADYYPCNEALCRRDTKPRLSRDLTRAKLLHNSEVLAVSRLFRPRDDCRFVRRVTSALEVGDYPTTDAHQFIRCNRKVVVPRSRCRPHLVILQQVRVDEDTQLSAVTKRRHATVGLGNLPALELNL